MTTPANKAQVLIVASNLQVNYLLERVLISAGYLVTIAQDKTSAEHEMTRITPTIAIVGEKLTDGDSLELTRILLTRFPTLPVLLLVSQDTPDLLKAALHAGIRDYLCLPLRTEDILKAVQNGIQIAQRQHEWIMHETRRATASLQRQVNELESLSRISRSITASLDLDRVLSAVVDAAVELTGAEEGNLLLVDEVSGDLYMRAARNFQEDFVRTFRLPIKDSLAGNVIQTGKPILLDQKTPQKIKTAYLVQGLLYVPLLSRGKAIGVLGVDNRQSRTPFTEHHVKLISAMADYAVIAIENARLYFNATLEKNRLGSILASIQEGVLVCQEDRIILANQKARQLLDQNETEITGKLITEVIQHPILLDMLEANGKPASSHSAEVMLDDERVYSVQTALVQDVGLIVTIHDITLLKKLDQAKNDFIATVSHDLRSPLTAILGYVELLDRVGPVNDTQYEFIRRVQNSVHNITALVDDLLNLGRIEAGFDTRKEATQIDELIRFSVDGFMPMAAEKGLTLITNLPDTLPATLAKPVQMRQMIDNLVGNALKYTPSGGTIKVDGRTEGNQIIFQVTDTGLGIPSADLPFIFDKFFRGSNIPVKIRGTGLGLAIVKTIIESHNGRIWVNSVVGQGTTFTVVLPIIASTSGG